jgi:ABC-2 type transport system permease protein
MKETSNWNIMRISGPPNSVPSNVIYWIMAYIIPFTLVSCISPQILLIKEDKAIFYIYIFLLGGVVLYILSYAFWRYSIRFYKSTGN